MSIIDFKDVKTLTYNDKDVKYLVYMKPNDILHGTYVWAKYLGKVKLNYDPNYVKIASITRTYASSPYANIGDITANPIVYYNDTIEINAYGTNPSVAINGGNTRTFKNITTVPSWNIEHYFIEQNIPYPPTLVSYNFNQVTTFTKELNLKIKNSNSIDLTLNITAKVYGTATIVANQNKAISAGATLDIKIPWSTYKAVCDLTLTFSKAGYKDKSMTTAFPALQQGNIIFLRRGSIKMFSITNPNSVDVRAQVLYLENSADWVELFKTEVGANRHREVVYDFSTLEETGYFTLNFSTTDNSYAPSQLIKYLDLSV